MARPKAMKHSSLSLRAPRAIAGTSTRPQISEYPSAYPSEAVDHDSNRLTFRFLDLPFELRNKIYYMVFAPAPAIIDLDPSNFSLFNRKKLLAVFRANKQLYRETTHHFLSTHTFRLFSTHPSWYFTAEKPLLARLPVHYRQSITSLDLRVGPGWNNPPGGWVVNGDLGLADCINVRVLKVFVECDPSDVIFKGFRAGDGFYERFCAGLLEGVLKEVPTIQVVEFDAYTSVKRTGDMMSGLGEVVSRYDKAVAWGPGRGWDKESDQVWLDAILLHGGRGKKLRKNVAVFG